MTLLPALLLTIVACRPDPEEESPFLL
ncbi:MAG: hypothetical protein RIT28_3040, partial [Pseudomonadota bacterium]